jgi:hypothetical protein
MPVPRQLRHADLRLGCPPQFGQGIFSPDMAISLVSNISHTRFLSASRGSRS